MYPVTVLWQLSVFLSDISCPALLSCIDADVHQYCIGPINGDDEDDDETEHVLNQASVVSVSVAVHASCRNG